MKKTKKNIATMAIIGGLVVTGCFGNVSADKVDRNSIGTLVVTDDHKTATAITTISSAAKPATGFSAYAKITTTNKQGVTKSKFEQGYVSSIAVSRTASGGNEFKKAVGNHTEYQGGNPLISTKTKISF